MRVGVKRCNSIALMVTRMLQATLSQDVVSPLDAGPPHTAIGTTVGSLARIFEPGVQIAWFERAPVPAITDYVHAVSRRLGSGRSRVVHADDDLPDLELPDQAAREALLSEIGWLTGVYTDLLGCSSAALRIEVLDRPMCPRFHVDRTGIRLVCTLRGPGTEWLHDGWADRSRLGPGSRGLADEESGLMLPGAEVERIPTFAVGLLKGSLWQDNADRGAIHRSPQIPTSEGPRVMLSLDAIWDD
ncbi:MAG: DUF1826 domain-containing protein [Thioalkalivibrio sp.]|nr:MAG: DUF1826 domain-containing protein [Thioalkalivibrio sp.]